MADTSFLKKNKMIKDCIDLLILYIKDIIVVLLVEFIRKFTVTIFCAYDVDILFILHFIKYVKYQDTI